MLTLEEFALHICKPGGKPLSRQRLHILIQQGRIPAAKMQYGRWLVPKHAKIHPPVKQ